MDGKGRSKENHLEIVDSEAQKVMAEDTSNAMKLSSASSDVSTDSISKVQMSDTSESGDDSSDDDEDSLEHLIQQPKPKLLAWLLKKGSVCQSMSDQSPLPEPIEESFEILLCDSSTNKFLSITSPYGSISSTPCIGAVMPKPNADCMLKLFFLSNGKVALQANSGKYLSRIAYSNDATDIYNRIQPAKSSVDIFCQFELEYTASSINGPGTITLKADNGRYLAPHDGPTIKPLSSTPFSYDIFECSLTEQP